MIRAIIFDYYGVMCPTIVPIIANKTAKQFGVKYKAILSEIEGLLDLMDDKSITFNDYWRRLKTKFGNDDANLSEQRGIWKESTFGLNLDPEMKGLVLKLRKHGYKVPVLTNVTRLMAKYNRVKGRYKIFSPVFLSYDIGLKKPDPRIFRYVVKKLKLMPKECVFIDDKKIYLKGAKSVGIRTILFKNIKQLRRELKRFGIDGI